ncbi:MMPL family transporter [Streptomyces sp. SID3343]|uniref:MMPL family transporter n=1 Tax=Streptomyces sp. SID3343 TaxID=2690260 RepID=UPI00136B82AD|nr:MMPL family transporter [Streptomyces sp. SID3343]MYW00302.1 MMPL family transporter [Streptomyces sp. SID3343]
MATFLYRLGRLTFRRRRLALLIWVAILVAVGVGAASASKPAAKPFSIPGIEAQKAIDLLEERSPDAGGGGATARIVFRAPAGQQIDAQPSRAGVEKTMGALKDTQEIAGASDPFSDATLSKDKSTAYATVDYLVGADLLKDSSREILKAAVKQGQSAGLKVEVGGDALVAESSVGNGEIIGVGVAAVVLAITFGAMIAAGLPLLTAILGVGIGIAGITAVAGIFDLSESTSTLAMMIGLAVGIDYALFIVSRYRSELKLGREPEEAAGRAVGTAGSAVVFAGLTVVIALSGLAVVNIPVLTEMGLAAAFTVVIAVLVALTFVPALLGFAGKRIFGRKDRKRAARHEAGLGHGHDKPNMGSRWARFVLKHPVAVLLISVVGLGAVALPAASMNLGLPDDSGQPTSTTQRQAYDMLAESFGPGFNGPLLLVVDTAKSTDAPGAAEAVRRQVEGLKGKGVASVGAAAFNDAGNLATFQVTPTTKPSDPKTETLVHDIRAAVKKVEAPTGAKTLVSGTPALNIDFSQKLNDALIPYLILVVGLAFLLLIAVFRSILVPLKAALGFLLSVTAALGAVVMIFQYGWLNELFGVEQTGPIMSMMPIFLIGVVFGLAMDYEVFLVTGMREAFVHGESPREAIVSGFRHGARVVTAAAIIMIAVFAGFIGATDSMIKMIGFGLAAAVFLDAFVVRMALVPAVLALLGKSAWWLPKWLDRILPNVDVEGESLRKHIDAQAANTQEPHPDRDLEPAGV